MLIAAPAEMKHDVQDVHDVQERLWCLICQIVLIDKTSINYLVRG